MIYRLYDCDGYEEYIEADANPSLINQLLYNYKDTNPEEYNLSAFIEYLGKNFVEARVVTPNPDYALYF